MSVLTVNPKRPASRPLTHLRAMVLLGGSVRAGAFGSAIGRLVFQLPLEAKRTILDAWTDACKDLALLAEQVVAVRVMIDKAAPQPLPINSSKAVEIERDPFDFRGTGGVLRDLAAPYSPDDYLLVANAAQILCEPLADLASALSTMGGDVSIVSHLDGTPSGLMLVRCGALASIPEHGFVDMKEQALPAIAKDHRVTVLHRQHPSALPVRSLSDYIHALRHHHQRMAGKSAPPSPFSEDCESTFAIVEEGASVDPSAKLHDSVVLREGKVEAGAVAVQSVICPGGILKRNEVTIDSLIHPEQREQKNGK
jgi:mannose-1-phosphate guanylyltransferase